MVKKLTILKVLEPFLCKPKESLHLAEISREINEPHPTARQWLNKLEREGVLRKQFKGRLTMYSLNLDNYNIMDYLIIAEKNKLITLCSKEPRLKEFTFFINSSFEENTKALIFGSSIDSVKKAEDIDLLIIGKAGENKIKDFAKRINKEIHIIKVSRLDKISKSLKEEIIKKHVIIKGSEDIIRWILW
ncbi:hypothetical protein KY343_03340 [Candidatus Woesearchaeota archaeon]|nr:hypothetical protein [Candidatus Woesearchaeota archaeon]